MSRRRAYQPGRGRGQTQRRPKLAERWPHASTSSGRGTPSSGRTSKKIGKRASDTCWWCDRGVKQSREHLFESCKKWKSQQAILWAEVRKKTQKRKGQVQISESFVGERCSPAVLDFLRSTGVSRTVPREDGENEEEDQDGASESAGAED